ncbi:uncharacterized protein PFLUO_LOCUS7264 [Penicillium psychrofluorescens]|uniref:uncharacterized protein n=1 Tax=Penicillium psychrofluorescens TaxID=3158075 RepID=UPI003CCDED88
MASSQSARASTDKGQKTLTSPRPGIPRTPSASSSGSHKPDPGLKGSRSDQPLVKEDERPPIPAKSASAQSKGDEVWRKTTPQESDCVSNRRQEPAQVGFPEVTIAVVGEENAGKSSFIRRALDLKTTPAASSSKKKMSLDGSVYIVRMLEVDLKEVRLGSKKNILWPKSSPRIDGALVLHDATEPEKLEEMTDLLDSLDATALPFLLVACKCDLTTDDSKLEPLHGRYEIRRTSPESPRSQRMCIALVLRTVIAHREDLSAQPKNSNPPSSSPPQKSPDSTRQSTTDRHHARAKSENPTALTGAAGSSRTTAVDRTVDGDGGKRRPTDQAPSSNLAHQTTARPSSSSRYARSNSQPVRPQTPPSAARLNPRRPSATSDSPNRDQNRQQRMHTAWRDSVGLDAFSSFLNMDEELEDGQSRPTSPGGGVIRPKPSSESNSSAESGLSFDELVDRLVAMPMSKNDNKFQSIFLCLYRKFAAPASLLGALITRFDRNETNTTDQLARIADQLRLLNVVAQWASEYPGDFAYPKTRKRITEFVATLEKSHFYMFAAKEIGSYLDLNAEDDEVSWAFSDGDVGDSGHTETFFHNSGRSSPVPFLTSAYDDDEEEEDPIYSMSALDLSDGPHDSTSRLSASVSLSSNPEKPSSTLNLSFTMLTTEAAQKEAARLELTPRTLLSKVQWRYFMETPEEEFARELTRIDWIMYNSFRPRDLVRHVSISGMDKEKIKSLKNVNRMIKQFNHLAFFVASMILLRDKPKHRAKALEKFMLIAAKLRRQNNYNSLGAVIAAINGTPVHRLNQTRDLIPAHTQKEFMRLVILMSTQRSHFAYRLAWENSFTERIPFLPLHRRDLVSAEEGNKTFVGENRSRINWKKFEVMGEVVLGIQRSQKTPHPQAHRYDDVERLILNSKFSGDEEDLYSRSLYLEPSTGGEAPRRKFGWLRS